MTEFEDSPPYTKDRPKSGLAGYLQDRKVRFGLCGLAISGLLFLGLSQTPLSDEIDPHRSGLGSDAIVTGTHGDHERVEATWAKLLANIGSRAGAADGLVIASPSKSVPDYYYHWTRDAAMTLSSILPSLTSPLPTDLSTPPSLSSQPLVEDLIRAFIASQAKMQLLETPSGGFWTGGLGEPKFMVDGSVFEGSWGRPQRDGPPLRALLLLQYASYLLNLTSTTPSTRSSSADLAYVRQHMYDPEEVRGEGRVLKADLEYSAKRWDEGAGFDLWEEIKGTHFFGLGVTARALRLGSTLANHLNDHGAADFYASKAQDVSDAIEDGYWQNSDTEDEGDGYLRATKELIPKEKALGEGFRTGLDCALPLGMIHGVYEAAGNPLAPNGTDMRGVLATDITDERYLATLRMYVKSFDGIYGLNGKKGEGIWTDGWLVGRYAEDLYDGWGIKRDGANPWFICSYSMAHVLRLLADEFTSSGQIRVSKINRPFWTDVLAVGASKTGSWTTSTAAKILAPGASLHDGDHYFEYATEGLIVLAERFEKRANEWVGEGYSMSEQIQRHDGSLVGAKDLTWSYASWFALVRHRLG